MIRQKQHAKTTNDTIDMFKANQKLSEKIADGLPIYANLFMNHFEETYIYPLLTKKCNFYKRYINDIFLLWQGTLEELQLFINQINKLHPTIKFTEEVSFSAIDFLD